ncbi:MAG: histidine kinase dimerization/phosphoacceptor domain -containing protein [Flavobacteriales bacterium]
MRLLLIFGCVLFSVATQAQLKPQQKDSLWNLWNDNSQVDSIRYDAIYILAQKGFLYTKPDSAYALAEIHSQRAIKEGDFTQIGLSHLTKGISWAIRGDYDLCRFHFQRTLDIHDSIGYERGSMMASLNLGNLYRIQGDTTKALQLYRRSEMLSKKLNNEIGVARNLIVQSRMYAERKEYDSALVKINLAIEIDSKIDNWSELADSYTNQGNIYKYMYMYDLASKSYLKALDISRKNVQPTKEANALSQLANLNSKIGEYEEALKYSNDAIAIQKKNNYKEGLINAYGGKMSALENLQRYDEWKTTIDSAKILIEAMGDSYKKINILNSLSNYYLQTKNYAKSLEFCVKADSLIKTSGGDISFRKNYILEAKAQLGLGNLNKALEITRVGYDQAVANNASQIGLLKLLAELYSETGNSDKAYEHLNKYSELKSKIDYDANQRAVLKANAYNAYEKKALADSLAFEYQERILLQENKTQKNISTAAIIGLSIFALLAIFLFRSRRTIATQKEQISVSLDEKDTLLREIHHRVKNNLQVVSSLLRLQTRSTSDEAAIDALTEGQNRVQSMSLIHQNLYQKENLTGIKMKDYLSSLSQNLFNTYKINSDQIKLRLEIQDLNLDVDTVVPLGLIINELLSNSLKYAFPNNSAGEIIVALSEQSDTLKLEVSDNGIGISEDILTTQQSSFGFTLIQTFTKKLKATLDIKNDNGARVEMSIKNYMIHP